MAATLTIVNQHGQTLATHRLAQGQSLAIRARDQVQYHLAAENGLAPNAVAERAGKDLLVKIDGEAALRIEDYFLFDDSGLKNPLLSLNGNGQYVAYGMVDTPAVPVEHVLAEEVAAVGAAGEGASIPALTVFGIGALALGGMALAASDGKDNSAATPQQPQTPFDPNQPAPPADNPPPAGGGSNPPSAGGGNNPPPTTPAPNGKITLSGDAKVGQTLSAQITDPDGVSGSPRYQWLADGQAIQGATQSTYILTAADQGKAISVQATYTDGKNTTETPQSRATDPVAADNTPAPDDTPPTLTISAAQADLAPGASILITFKVSEAVKGFTADDVIVQGGTLSGFRQIDATTFTATFTAGAAGHASVQVADDAFFDLADNPNESASLDLAISAAPTPPQNRAPTDITLSANGLPENKAGAIIGKLTTTDPDLKDTHTYTVNDTRFEVDAQGNLKLKDGVKVEFANEQTINLTITTTDKAGEKYSEPFTINVQDDPNYPAPQNRAPTDIRLSANGLPENKAGAVIGKLTTTDPDLKDTHTYTVNDTRFEVDAQGNLKLKDGVKVEFANEQTINLTITTRDQGGKTHQETFTINVQDDPNYPAPPPPAANQTARVGIVGLAQVGKTLAAKVTDGNGFDESLVQYQWFADDKPIVGATQSTYTPTAADSGKNLSVQALYTDRAGHHEAPVSDLTASVIAPPQGNTYLPKPPNDYVVSVKDGAFKAKGDGQSDDTAAIQKAIDAAAEKGGGVVEVPGGVYLIDGLTSVNMRSNVTLKLADDAVLKAIPNDSEGYVLVEFNQVENAHMTGGTLVGDRHEHGTLRGEWGHGVGIYSSKNIVVENVVARDFWGDGFSVGRSWGKEQGENITLNQITGDNNRRQAVFVSDGKNIKILNSLISNVNGIAPQAGIDLEPDPNREINGVEVRGNTFENNHGWGFLVSMVNQQHAWVKNVVVEDNLFKNNERAIALWGLTGGRVANNTIHHDGDERMPVGITVSEHTSGVTVEGNTIYGGGINARLNSAEYNTIGKNAFKSGVFIFGDPKTGEALTARVIDADNPKTEYLIPEKSVQYQWYANGEKIEGATAGTYTPVAADHGKTLSVRVAFTDANGNAETAESRATLPVDSQPPNRTPHNILLNGENYPKDLFIPEGKPGAIIGKITILDADPGDTHTYFVRDRRFEIKNGVLKLKDGVKIDYEHEKEIFLALYAFDQDKANELREYTLPVADDPNYHGKVNQKPTDLLLSNNTVMENRPGATVGKLTPVDPDGDGFYTYHLSDRRFYVDEQGYLKVRDGVILEHGGRSIPITTTVTDSGGNRHMKTFYVRVQDDPDWPANRPGQVKVEGNARIGQTLTASIADPDGAPDTIQYQWYADGEKIAGVNSASYTVQNADLGKQLTAEARYTDNSGHIETAESPRTFPVASAAQPKILKVNLEPELNLDNLVAHGTDGQDTFVIDGNGVKIMTDLTGGDSAMPLLAGENQNSTGIYSPPPLAGEGQGGGGNHSPLAGDWNSPSEGTGLADGHKTPTITGLNLNHGDLLQLDSNAFPALEKGTLAESAFTIGSAATTADHRILYNPETGELAYDPDGNGSATAHTIAHLDPTLELEAQHIHII